ncbi:LysR family transcriptional regulator [Desulfovibrio inopinatus]|uniref:LysR family transcriptional regulator n=1 Tax=Desulfovibrio inopinatus TaxID=102109 RepID=UPI00041E726E|nr:LysR family transcriptional regulator [Desulfovibrio inopinatus]
MEIRHLRLIQAITEEGSLTKATTRLHLTQSALSRQLQEAEYQLGTKIFLRVNKKLVLTEAGEQLLQLADDILDKIEDTERRIRKLIHGEEGEIRISTECYTSYHWLPALMRQFQTLYPNVTLRIVMEATHQPLEKLLSGDLDIAITSDPIRNMPIRYTPLFRDEMYAVVAKNHPWADKPYVTAQDFAAENLIIHSLPLETVSVYQFVLAPANVTPARTTILPLTEAAIEMVRAEMGVFVMAHWALEPYLKTGGLKKVRIGSTGLKRDHFVATLKARQFPAYFHHFIDFLKQEITLNR